MTADLWRRYGTAWAGAAGLGVLNGVARGALYEKRLGERTAHQVSSVTLIGLLAAYLTWLERRGPIPSRRDALEIGAAWTGATVAFELGFGHFVAGESWENLLGDYVVTEGRLWGFVLAWLALGPLAVRERLKRG